MKIFKKILSIIFIGLCILLIYLIIFSYKCEGSISSKRIPKNKDYSYEIYDEYLIDSLELLGFSNLENEEKIEPIIINYDWKKENSIDIEKIKNEIYDYLDSNNIPLDLIGISFYDVTSDSGFGINENELFLAASTMKVPINVYTYDIVNKGDLSLSRIMTYYKKNYEEGTGVIQFDEFGSTYSLRDILRLSITESDNVATNMLYSLLGGYGGYYLLDQLHDYYGISSTKGNYISPREALKTLIRVYDGRYDIYKLLYKDMASTVYNEYATFYFNDDKGVHHKTGDYEGYYNDIVIVEGENTFIFTIYTNNINSPIETLQDLGEIIYENSKR